MSRPAECLSQRNDVFELHRREFRAHLGARAKHHVNLEGVLSWAFEFEDQPWFAGYRQLSTNGVDLPVLNVFRMFAKLGPERIAATSDAQIALDRIVANGVRGETDVACWRHALRKAPSRCCSGTITTMICQGPTPRCA